MKKIFIIIFLLSACANQSIKQRTIEEYYQSSGVEKYFLSSLPIWANFSTIAGCFRNEQIQYLDLNALMKSYSVSYATALQIQGSYNEEYLKLTKLRDNIVPFSEMQLLFFRASDRVNSKIVFFEPPSFNRIHLVWVDNVDTQKVKKFLKSSVHDKGIPILLSFCLTKNELEAKFSESNYKIISAEMFSIFDITGAKTPAFGLSLDQLFKANQEVILYSPQAKQQEINEIKGKYQVINY
jgi:hypothetical protein